MAHSRIDKRLKSPITKIWIVCDTDEGQYALKLNQWPWPRLPNIGDLIDVGTDNCHEVMSVYFMLDFIEIRIDREVLNGNIKWLTDAGFINEDDLPLRS